MTSVEQVSSTRPSRRARAWATACVAILSTLGTYSCATHLDRPTDFAFWWRGARVLLDGANPYLLRPNTPAWPLPDPLFYPLPALLFAIPLAPFVLAIAQSVFMGLSSGVLAWRLSREGMWRLCAFVSASYVQAVHFGQWTPLLVAAALLPGAGMLFAVKPNLGVPLFLYRPSWWTVAGCAAIAVLSFIVLPSWLGDWRANLAALGRTPHPVPILTPLGALLVLAVLRWRQPEARLLLAMACVPQLLFFADQLPLWLIPRTRREMVLLTSCSLVAGFVWMIWGASRPNWLTFAAPWVVGLVYLPALVIVLIRPNEGDVPLWLDRGVARVRAVVARSS